MKVHLLTAADLHWGFDAKTPSYRLESGDGSFGRTVEVDPHPCYAADKPLVEDLVGECCERFPLTGAGAANLFLLSHEGVGRTNAFTYEDWLYGRPKEMVRKRDGGEEESYPQAHTIALYGKRIPIMPAMLRYLVAHEYGHAAFNHVAQRIGFGQHHDELERAYMELRGGDVYRGSYGGGGWHKTASEIVANDFRILVMGREIEFWPHEVPRPEEVPAIGTWWEMAREVCR